MTEPITCTCGHDIDGHYVANGCRDGDTPEGDFCLCDLPPSSVARQQPTVTPEMIDCAITAYLDVEGAPHDISRNYTITLRHLRPKLRAALEAALGADS